MLMPTTMVMLDLMLMDTDHMDTQLMAMVTTERDLLMLSQRLRLMLTMVFMDTVLDMPDMDTQLTDTMERDLLKLSQRLMPTTDTLVMLDLMLMVLTHMPMVPTEESGDKLNATQLKEAQKQTTNINDTQFPKNKLNYCWCRNLS